MKKIDMLQFARDLFSGEFENIETNANEVYVSGKLLCIPVKLHWYKGNNGFRIEANNHSDLLIIISCIGINLGKMGIVGRALDCECEALIRINNIIIE